jgi:prevent-host-death family protein
MTRVTAEKAQGDFSSYVERVSKNKERIMVTRGRKRIAAIVPIEDLRLLELMEDKADIKDADEAMKETREKGSVSWEKVKADLAL